ncbi:MAG: zinc-ribbon domain-containing protein [Paracoccus sp. (in: a-proteobacteria)]|uniref:zinc-ribbon domain-containing protein n=1 Tax=Paracoccus sp. TaxID=267 RepID=UPI0039E5AE71
MRLTCPRCQAQYDIPDAVIPSTGREVECSACGHVWHQAAASAPENPAEPAPLSLMPSMATPTADAEAPRPALSRPLDDSVLSILREEATRELTARAGDAHPQGTADHISAIHEDAPAPRTDQPEADNGLPPAGLHAPIAWPVSTVILPGDPLPADAAPEAPPLRPSTGTGRNTPPPQPEAQAKPLHPAAETALPEPVASITEPDEAPPKPRELPDAARLAATLTRPLPVDESSRPAPPRPKPEASPIPVPAQPVSTSTSTSGRGRYALGFGLVVVLALAFLALYALPPRPAPGSPLEAAQDWRQRIDGFRLWLHDLVSGDPT